MAETGTGHKQRPPSKARAVLNAGADATKLTHGLSRARAQPVAGWPVARAGHHGASWNYPWPCCAWPGALPALPSWVDAPKSSAASHRCRCWDGKMWLARLTGKVTMALSDASGCDRYPESNVTLCRMLPTAVGRLGVVRRSCPPPCASTCTQIKKYSSKEPAVLV